VFSAENAQHVRASRIVRSAFALMFSTVASSALGMVFWVAAAHLFRTEEVGRASAGVSAIMLLGGLGQLGLSSVLIRFVPIIGGAVGRFLNRAYLLSIGVSLVLAVGFVALGLGREFLGRGALWAAAFCAAVVCGCLSSLQDGVLTGLKRTSWVPVENVAIALGRLLLLPALIASAAVNPVLIAWGLPMGGAVVVISAAIFGWLLPRHVRAHARRVRMPGRRELIRFTSAGYANGLLGNLTAYLPPVFITAVLGPAANAVFFVPWLVGTVISGLLWNIASSFVVEATSDAARTGTHLRHATRLVLLVCVGSTVPLAAGAPWLLRILGEDYAAGGATTLRLIGLTVPFGCVILIYTVSLLMERRNWAIFRLNCFSAALWLPLSVLGMYRFGVSGVAGGILAADAIVALCLLPAAARRYRALANRSIDDDVTMIVDLESLRAELREQDRAEDVPFAPGLPGRAVTPGSDDETAVLDLAELRAALRQHNPGAYTPDIPPSPRGTRHHTAAPDLDATVVLARIEDTPAVPRVRLVRQRGPGDEPGDAVP
jgi:O-antigen/teichoic acid export membrane protein